MPKKAVAIYLILALIGAALFIFFTFPRTKDEIPTSNNQRPFPSVPAPNNLPVPETPPHPASPAPQKGPTLHVMAWASPAEAQALGERLDAYAAQTGWSASLTLVGDEATYRRELPQALAANVPPDVCLVDARDFSGANPATDLADVTADPVSVPRSVAAFTVNGAVKALPAEFSTDLLYFNPSAFDRAGIAAPGPHWNWDMLEAMSRAIASLKLKTDQGAPIYALELPANFDFWNLLCTQAGHPALDTESWHLADVAGKDAEMRSLEFIHSYFQVLSITAPLSGNGDAAGPYFARQQAAMMIGPSDLVTTIPDFGYQVTDLPRDMCSASLAQVRGWAVAARSPQADAARSLAIYLAEQPLHAGWTSVRTDAAKDGFSMICQSALSRAVIPRLGARDEALAHFLDDQIGRFARDFNGNPGQLYARIQSEYQNDFPHGGSAKSTAAAN